MGAWYSVSAAEAVQALRADPERGLAPEEVQDRRKEYGWNELLEKKGLTVWGMFLTQFKELLVMLLAGAALISFAVGEATDAAVILAVIIVNAVLGVIQEYRAERSLAALKTLTAPTAKVMRGGSVLEIPARELVPGDLVLLDAGDYVPADARLLEVAELMVDESALTGESVPVEKDAAFTADGAVPLADQKSIVHMGTVATAGRARTLVTATGMETEIGRIAGMIHAAEPKKTPLQKNLAQLGRRLALLAVALCILIFGLGLLRGNGLFEMFLISVSLAVAAIPEGLPAIVTVVLALGVQRMARRNAIIRKLPAVETLGAATVICSDKTGTLTRNAMTVRRVFCGSGLFEVTGEGYEPEGDFRREGRRADPAKEPHLSLLLSIGALTNDARFFREAGERRVVGDPTEAALLSAAEKAGLEAGRLAAALPRQGEFPFDSVRKQMSTIHRGPLAPAWPELSGVGLWLLAKGAPDLVLARCRRWLGPAGLQELNPDQASELLELNRAMAGQALRVLGFAFRPLETAAGLTAAEAETDLIFAGFMGMIDPPRPEAKRAIEICRKAQIKVKMITGDHRETALAVASELGLAFGADEVITGVELDRLSDDELTARVGRLSVFARVAPEHKVRIVKALKANGEIVAMTGDGVNDAPALKQADIGTAMGKTGTAVAREAAEMVLADDNFSTIVRAVEEGRVIFENIRKAVFFLLSCNIGEILAIMMAILVGWPLPLLPVQILWVNLVTDTLPALALGVEPPEKGIMNRPPRGHAEGIFGPGSKGTVVVFGLMISLITLAAFWAGLAESIAKGQSMAFATLAISQLVHVFNFRSLHGTVLKRDFLSNRSLLLAVFTAALLQAAVLFVPFLMAVFRVVTLGAGDWAVVAGLSLAVLLLGELWKTIMRGVASRRGGRE